MLAAIRKFFKPQQGGQHGSSSTRLSSGDASKSRQGGEDDNNNKKEQQEPLCQSSSAGDQQLQPPSKGGRILGCGSGGQSCASSYISNSSSDRSCSKEDDVAIGSGRQCDTASYDSSDASSTDDGQHADAVAMEAANTVGDGSAPDDNREAARTMTTTTTGQKKLLLVGVDADGSNKEGQAAVQCTDDEDDEEDDEDYDDDEEESLERVSFIATAATTRQQQLPYQQANKSQRLAAVASCQQQYQQQQQQAQPVSRIKTEVEQLLTVPDARLRQHTQQQRDSVRGNLEELRVAESVNYRPVVYKYSFRLPDVPANMRVFTDPDDRRIEAIARSCDSQIHLEKLPVRGPGSLRVRKVTIQSPDLHSLEKCCRQFDDRFPHFYVSGGLGLSSKSIQRVYVDELPQEFS